MAIFSKKILLFLPLFFLLAFNACSPAVPAVTPTAEVSEAPPTLEPVATPQPIHENLVVAGLETWDAHQQEILQPILNELSQLSGLTPVYKTAAEASTAVDQAKAVILLSEIPDLYNLAASHSQVRFAAVSRVRMDSAENLLIWYLPADQQAFLAGYMSVNITPDIRAAGLFSSDEPLGSLKVYSFSNGGSYQCGSCYPYHSPLVQFPQVAYLPSAADDQEWLAAAQQMMGNVVYSMYLDETAARPAVMDVLIANNVFMMGEKTPVDSYKSHWAATISFDLAESVRNSSDFIKGAQSGSLVTVPLSIYDINEGLFSPGRQREVNNIKLQLEAGYIAPVHSP